MASTKIEWEKLPPISQSYKNRYGTVPKTRTIKIGTKRRNITVEIDRKPKPGEFEKNWRKQFEKEYNLEVTNPVPAVTPPPEQAMFPVNKNVAPSEGTRAAGPAMFSHEILEAAQAALSVQETIDRHCAWNLPDETTEAEQPVETRDHLKTPLFVYGEKKLGFEEIKPKKTKNKKKKGQNGSA